MKCYEDLIDFFYKKANINLSLYKENQMKRRIETFINQEIGKVDYAQFIDKLNKDEDLLFRFKDRITINVTEFFRNPAVWENLKTKVIPEIIKSSDKKKLTIWSAGCSSGEEPYSLAMLMEENFPKVDWRILATDLDVTVLEKCKIGQYGSYQVSTLNDKLKEKYFKEISASDIKNQDGFITGESVFEIDKKLRNRIEFKRQNLLEDIFPKNVDLILCRNVVIYFTEETKSVLYQRFADALRDQGILVIGNTEHIVDYKSKGFTKIADWTFEKTNGGSNK